MLLYRVKLMDFTRVAMKLEENIRLSKLYDAYGKLLTLSQQEIVEAYLFDDLTGSEMLKIKTFHVRLLKMLLLRQHVNLKGMMRNLVLLQK